MLELQHIILASASPRRAELLQQIGVSFQIMALDIEERVHKDEVAVTYVVRLAREKALAGAILAQQQGMTLPVLGADTVVEFEGEIMGKPVDNAQAGAMLQKLSGHCHQVHTAVTLVCDDVPVSALSSSIVEFAEISQTRIEHYVASAEPLDKAGGYAIQGSAAQFIKSLHGSYSGVMGLPLYETAQLLKTCESQRS